jgi:DNA-binding CsgD family transcriptional regulator
MELTIPQRNKIEITDKEARIVQGVADGLRTPQIGDNLKLSPRTIETYLQTLRKKTASNTTSHLVATFMRQGLID